MTPGEDAARVRSMQGPDLVAAGAKPVPAAAGFICFLPPARQISSFF
jgi:hypothetical protein